MTITIEGKWQNISRIVHSLERQGWTVLSAEPDAGFTMTVVTISNER